MAPEVTTTIRSPVARAVATSSATLSMAAASTCPPSVVTDDEPTFTTTVRGTAPTDPVASSITSAGPAGR